MAQARLLFVDDDAAILKWYRRRFEKMGYEVYCANTAAEAVELVKTTQFDAVIADLDMPGENGAQLLLDIQNNQPDVIRFMVTGHADIADSYDGINRASIHKHFVKPLNENALREDLEEALSKAGKN